MCKVVFIFLFIVNTFFILPKAFSQDINISADNVIWDRKKEITTLTGNVLITRGSISISSAKIQIFGKLSGLNKIIGEGNIKINDRERDFVANGGYMQYCRPTEYFLITNNPKLELKKENIVITAKKIEVFYKNGEFIATDSVKITQKDTIITGAKLVYLEGKKRLELTGNPQIISGGNKLEGKKIVYYSGEDRFEVIGEVKAVLVRE